MSQILESAKVGGATRTKIVYRSYLTYSQVEEYLTILTQCDLAMTAKGRYLRLPKKVLGFLTSIMRSSM